MCFASGRAACVAVRVRSVFCGRGTSIRRMLRSALLVAIVLFGLLRGICSPPCDDGDVCHQKLPIGTRFVVGRCAFGVLLLDPIVVRAGRDSVFVERG